MNLERTRLEAGPVFRLAFTLAIGPVTVAVLDGIHWAFFRGDLLTGEAGPIAARCVLIALPFVALFAAGVRRLACWIVPACATWLFHGYFLWRAIEGRLAGAGGGADIGYGLLMLVFPIFALMSAFAAYLVSDDRPAR